MDLYRAWPGLSSFFSQSAQGVPYPGLFQHITRLLGFPVLGGTGALCVGLYWSAGKRLVPLLGLRVKGPIRFLFEVACGFVLVHWAWLGLGFNGLWSGPLVALAMAGLTVRLLMDLWKLKGTRFKVPVVRGWDRAMAGVVLVYTSFLFLQDVLPETFYDSLNYFLGIPAYWWSRHGITDQPLHILSGYFHGGSLLYLSGFLLGGGAGAKMLAGSFLLMSALLAWTWAGEWGDGSGRWTAAAMLLSFPLLYLNAWATRVDSLQVLVTLLFFYAVQKVLEGPGAASWVAVSGLLAGLALAIKPTAIVPILGGLVLLGIGGQWFSFLKKGWLPWAVFGLLETGPWLLKNAVFTGDPFFPYLANRFGARPIPAWDYQRLLHENQQFLPMDEGWRSWVTLPWRLTMPGAGDGQFLGPLLLAVLPVLVVLVWRKGPLRPLSIAFWVTTVMGLSLSHMLRFSLPVFALGLLLAGAALSGSLKGPWRSLWPGMVLVNALFCFPELFALSAQWSAGGPFWTVQEDQVQYLSRRLGKSEMEMAELVNQELPRDSRILFVGDSRVLYYDRQALAQSVFDEPFFVTALREGKDEAGILAKLKETGITHVVVHQGLGHLYSEEYKEYEGLSPSDWRLLQRFSQSGLEALRIEGAVGLFRVRDHLVPPNPKIPNPFSLLPAGSAKGLEYMNLGNLKDAGKAIDQMLELFPGDPFWLAQKMKLNSKIQGKTHE